MKFVVTAKEMKEYDNNTITKIGIPALVLMERAALKLQEEIVKRIEYPQTALIVSGVGNNGADGLALARLLADKGCKVTCCILGKLQKCTEQFETQRNILKQYPVQILEQEQALQELSQLARVSAMFDVVTDALFGVGLSRDIEGIYAEAVRYMNRIRGYKVATDIASGICADTGKILGVAFQADLTVAFGFAKRGLYLYPGCEYSGKVVVADIGITEKSFFGQMPGMFVYEEEPCALLPQRLENGNKGTFGKVLIIAGFEQMAGAAILSSKAALEIGAGMVKVLSTEQNRGIIQTDVPEVLYGTCENMESSIQWADVVAIGPGLGKSEDAQAVLKQILETCELPLVLDADALNLISESRQLQSLVKEYKAAKVMTPHMGELARLTGKTVLWLKEHMVEAAEQCAEQYNAIMVCKDARTMVAGVNEPQLYMNISGNNGMATAGSGDVLTGILAGLMAQEKDIFKAVTTGVYLHGLAGDKARDIYTEYGVTAGKIVENIRKL